MVMIINGFEEVSDIEDKLKRFLEKKSLICSKCAYVLYRNKISCEYGMFVSAKCGNKKCLHLNRFVFLGHKPKVLNRKLLEKVDEKYWSPYTKNDMIEWLVE